MDRLFKIPYWAFMALLVYMPFHIFLSQWLSTFTGGLEVWKIWKDLLLFLAVLASMLLVYVKHGFPQASRLRSRFGLSLRNVLSRIKKYGKGVSEKKTGYKAKSARGVTSSASKQPSMARSLWFFWLVSGLGVLYVVFHLFIWVINPDIENGPALLATVYNCRLFGYLIIGFATAILFKNKINPKKVFKIIIILSTIVCLIALLQWFLPKDILTHFGYSVERGVKPAFFIDDKPDLPRLFSTLRDPNSLGAYLILPITLLSAAWFRMRQARVLISGLLLIHGLILFLTFSRSAWLGTAIGVATILLWQYKIQVKGFVKKYWLVLLVFLTLLTTGVFLARDNYVIQNIVFHADENTKLADSNERHVSYTLDGIKKVTDKPIGYGPGTAGVVSIQTKKHVLPENYFVQIAYEVGLLGLILLLYIMYLVIKKLYQRQDFYGQVMIASFIGITLSNLLLHTWSNEAVAAQWWLLAGITIGISSKRKNINT